MILVTHSSYMDVCNIFLKLFEMNIDPSEKKQLVISITGENIEIPGYNCIYNGKQATLPECIYNAARQCESKYYLCFLGDSFVMEKVNRNEIELLLRVMKKANARYVSLIPQRNYCKKKRYNELMRYIGMTDRYSHSFTAFAANYDFIEEEFEHGISDLDFELKYLEKVNEYETKNAGYFSRDFCLLENIFHIKSGIRKGKWDRYVAFYMKRKYPQFNYEIRKKNGIGEQIAYTLRIFLSPYVPQKMRMKIKKIFSEYFTTMT